MADQPLKQNESVQKGFRWYAHGCRTHVQAATVGHRFGEAEINLSYWFLQGDKGILCTGVI